MNRLAFACCAAALTSLVACGTSPSASNTPKGPPGPGDGRGGRGGAAGEVVKVKANAFVISAQTGDTTVAYTGSTTFTRTSTGTVGDIVVGTCFTAVGRKGADGVLTAATVRLSTKADQGCVDAPGGLPRGAPSSSAGTPPARTSRPGAPTRPAVRGEVTGVSGTSVTVKDGAGVVTTVTVPTTVRVSKASTASASDVTVGQCNVAAGPRDGAGAVAARTILIVPPGPSGCSAGGGFGRRRGGQGAPGGIGGPGGGLPGGGGDGGPPPGA